MSLIIIIVILIIIKTWVVKSVGVDACNDFESLLSDWNVRHSDRPVFFSV